MIWYYEEQRIWLWILKSICKSICKSILPPNQIFRCRVDYKGVSLLKEQVPMMAIVEKMKARPDDILIAGFPNSGTRFSTVVLSYLALFVPSLRD